MPLPLFAVDLPEGFQYRPDFISAGDERALAAAIDTGVTFSTFEMRGVVARRRVAFFGAAYNTGESAPAIPDFLLPIRVEVAAWAGIEATALAMALINEYPPGAAIGWHRDAPQYGIIAGISLLSACRMRLRPYRSPAALRGEAAAGRAVPRKTTHEITLEPRSTYLIAGPARTSFEHSIPATTTRRYSITFRTLR